MTERKGGRDEKYASSLIGQLRDQATRGGRQGPSSESASAGPYWTKANWEDYCLRIKNALIEQCGYSATEADMAIANSSSGVILY